MPLNQSSSSQSRPPKHQFPIYSVFIAILSLTTGCDALDVVPGNSIFLNTSRVICFEFTGLTDGGSKTVTSSDSFDLGSFLQSEGFTKSEIQSAEASDITIRLRFPGQENLSVFDGVSIGVRAGATSRTVASSSSLGTGRSTSLSPNSTDIGSVLRAASFQGVLEVTGAASIQDEFLVEVEVNFTVEMEGI